MPAADDALQQFEVRYAPVLANKPTADKGPSSTASTADDSSKPADPFAPPYQQDLFVAEETVKEDDSDSGEGFAVLVCPLLPCRTSSSSLGSRSPRPPAAQQVLRHAPTLPPRHQGVPQADDAAFAPRDVHRLVDPQAARLAREAPRLLQLWRRERRIVRPFPLTWLPLASLAYACLPFALAANRTSSASSPAPRPSLAVLTSPSPQLAVHPHLDWHGPFRLVHRRSQARQAPCVIVTPLCARLAPH